jgi:hypothetical protein
MFIGIVDANFFRLPHFNAVYDLTDSLKKISGVAEIVSITRLYNLVKNDSLKKFEFIPILPAKPLNQEALDSVRSLIFSLPFYEGLIYNKSTSAYLMALTLDKKTVQSKNRVRLIQEIKAMVDRFSARSETGKRTQVIHHSCSSDLGFFSVYFFPVIQGSDFSDAHRDHQRNMGIGAHGLV